MKKLLLPILCGLALLASPAAVQADYFFVVGLSGAGEVPPHDVPGDGVAFVILNDNLDTITVDVYFENLTVPASAAHIHYGQPDVAGPIILPFGGFPNDTDGEYVTQLTSDNLVPNSDIQTFDDAVNALFNGGCYMNIHTSTYPGGEIRGQVQYFWP